MPFYDISRDRPYTIHQIDEGYRRDLVSMNWISDAAFISNDKAKTVHGNFTDPLPYHHITCTSSKTGHYNSNAPSSISLGGVPYRNKTSRVGAVSGRVYSDYLYVDSSYQRITFTIPAGSYTEPDLKALVKLRDNQIEIGMALADARKTASTFVDSAVNLQKALIAMKKGDFKTMYLNLKYNGGFSGSLARFKKRLDIRRNKWHGDIESRWLESQFAVIPAMQDIHTLSEVYESGFEVLAPSIYVAAKGKSTERIKTLRKGTNGPETTSFSETGTFTHISKIFCVLDNYALKSLGKIGLDNPAVIAWDLLPFSFVIDWFLPIGNFIKAWSARLGVGFKSAYHSTLLDSRIEFIQERHSKSGSGDYWSTIDYKYTSNGIARAYKRVVLRTMPIPNLYLKENMVSLWHGATSLALLRQLLTPKHPSFLGFR